MNVKRSWINSQKYNLLFKTVVYTADANQKKHN